MSALTRPVRLACAVALVAWSGAGAPLSADAVGVPDAVTDVRIEEERAYTWSQVRLHLNWQVPDGTQAGDTFSLTLPPQLAATDGMTFPLNDAAGQAVANARVAGNVVTFTMTNYAENHTGVRGTAWFWVNFTEVVQPGEDLELAFEVESTTFRDTIRIGNPVPAPEDGAFKWQRWEHEAGQRLDRFLWAIDGPVVRENMINAPYEIVDVAGPGQAIDCDDVHIFAGGPQDWSNPAYITRNRLEEFACSTEQVSFTYFPTQAELGRSIRLLGHSDVTDTTLPAYRNSGVVRIWETAEWEVSHVLNAGGGGDGEGQEPTTPPTTEPGEPPTDEPTTPAPTDEPTTPAPTDEPTTPEPTDEPTTPAPTDEPTTPAPTDEPTTPAPTDEPTTPAPTDEPTTEPGEPVPTPTVTVTQPAEPAPTVTVTQPAEPAPTVTVTPPVVVVPGAPAPTVVVTVPAPPVVVVPGAPAPTVTVTAPPVTVSPGAPAPTDPDDDPTVIVPGTPVDPEPTVTVTAPAAPAAPAPTVTVTAAAPAAPPPAVAPAAPYQPAPASPRRIDTGVPDGIDARLAGAGGALALVSGIALVASSRRRDGD